MSRIYTLLCKTEAVSLRSLPTKMNKEKWDRIIEKDNKRVANVERAISRVERARDKADKKEEAKALRRFEKIADREMGLFDRETKRDYW